MALTVSVPLRGYGFEMKKIRLLVLGRLVSVPLRGYGFEMNEKELETLKVSLFPSPCGDMVLKSCSISCCPAALRWFPSPCGDMVLKFAAVIPEAAIGTKMFPSPYEDMVLKLLQKGSDLNDERTRFRPLAGIWF